MSLNLKALEVLHEQKAMIKICFSKERSPMTTLMDFSSQRAFFLSTQLPQCQETLFSLCQSPFQDPQPRAFFFMGEMTFPV